MYQGNDILKKPIVTFDTGEKIGTVHDLVFDQHTNTILGFLTDEGGWFSDARVLPLAKVKHVGPDAIIVEHETAIIAANQSERFESILEHNNVLKGTKVMTEDGQDLGTLVDLHFDEESGEVTGYEVSGGLFGDMMNGRPIIPAPKTIKIGEDVAFVPADTVKLMEAQKGGLTSVIESAGEKMEDAKDAVKEKFTDLQPTVTQEAHHLKKKGEEFLGTAHKQAAETGDVLKDGLHDLKTQAQEFWQMVKERATDLKEKGDSELEERRIKGALGRPVNRVIFDRNDTVILNVGDLITHEAIDRARQAEVLDILLSSVYTQEPDLDPAQLQA